MRYFNKSELFLHLNNLLNDRCVIVCFHDVGPAVKLIGELGEAANIATTRILLLLRVHLLIFAEVPVKDGWEAFDLESAFEPRLHGRVNLGEINLALHLGR